MICPRCADDLEPDTNSRDMLRGTCQNTDCGIGKVVAFLEGNDDE